MERPMLTDPRGEVRPGIVCTLTRYMESLVLDTGSSDNNQELDALIKTINEEEIPKDIAETGLLNQVIAAMDKLEEPDDFIQYLWEHHREKVVSVPIHKLLSDFQRRAVRTMLKEQIEQLTAQGVIVVRPGQRVEVGEDLMPTLVTLSLHPDYPKIFPPSPTDNKRIRPAAIAAGEDQQTMPPASITPSSFIRALLRHQSDLMSCEWKNAAKKLAQMDDGTLVASRATYSTILYVLQMAHNNTFADITSIETIASSLQADSRTLVVEGMELPVDIALPTIISRLIGVEPRGPMHYRVWEDDVGPRLAKECPHIYKLVDAIMRTRLRAVLALWNTDSRRLADEVANNLRDLLKIPGIAKQKTLMDGEIAVLRDLVNVVPKKAPESSDLDESKDESVDDSSEVGTDPWTDPWTDLDSDI